MQMRRKYVVALTAVLLLFVLPTLSTPAIPHRPQASSTSEVAGVQGDRVLVKDEDRMQLYVYIPGLMWFPKIGYDFRVQSWGWMNSQGYYYQTMQTIYCYAAEGYWFANVKATYVHHGITVVKHYSKHNFVSDDLVASGHRYGSVSTRLEFDLYYYYLYVGHFVLHAEV